MSAINISVVIPLFNKKDHIKRAVISALNQTFEALEIIVVDDGSTDGSEVCVKEINDPKVKLIRQKNSGVSVARNAGISLAEGDLISFLDADDEWKPCFLGTILRLRQKCPEAGMYAAAYEVENARKKYVPSFKHIPKKPWEGLVPDYFYSVSFGYPLVSASSVCIPKRFLIECGGFPIGIRMGEDIDTWGRLALRYPVAFSRQVGAVYYFNTHDRASDTFLPGDEHPFIETAEKMLRQGEVPDDLMAGVKCYIQRLRLENARQNVLAGRYESARILASRVHHPKFGFRRFIWGNRLNFLTHWLWLAKEGSFS